MLLFFFTAVPLAAVFTLWFYTMEKRKAQIQTGTFFKGLFWYALCFLILLLFHRKEMGSYKDGNLFAYYLVNDHGLGLAAALAGYFLFFGFHYNNKKDDKFIQSLSFLTGFYVGLSLVYFILYYGDFDIYLLFILPFLWCSTLLLVSFFIDKIFNSYGRNRLIFGCCIGVVPCLASFLALLFAQNLVLLALILSVVFYGLSWLVYFLVRDL